MLNVLYGIMVDVFSGLVCNNSQVIVRWMVVEPTQLSQLREQLNDAETMRLKLEYDLEHTHAADKKKTQYMSELTEKLKISDAECNKVC